MHLRWWVRATLVSRDNLSIWLREEAYGAQHVTAVSLVSICISVSYSVYLIWATLLIERRKVQSISHCSARLQLTLARSALLFSTGLPRYCPLAIWRSRAVSSQSSLGFIQSIIIRIIRWVFITYGTVKDIFWAHRTISNMNDQFCRYYSVCM
jgi:hypothetical protein